MTQYLFTSIFNFLKNFIKSILLLLAEIIREPLPIKKSADFESGVRYMRFLNLNLENYF